MRRPRKEKCAKSARYPRGAKYSGAVEYRGRQQWVGTYATRDEWSEAAQRVEADLRRARERGAMRGFRSMPTVADFAGKLVEADGKVVPQGKESASWPWTHKRKTRKESSRRTLDWNIRTFVRRFGDRRIDSFDRREAREIAAGLRENQKAAACRFFKDAVDDDLIDTNPFRELGVEKRSRLGNEDFRLVSDGELERLLAAADQARTDDYGTVIKAMIQVEAHCGVRPAEIFGMERELLDRNDRSIRLRHQIDDRGAVTLLKNELQRLVPIPPVVLEAINAAPVLSNRWLFTAVRGGPFKQSLWHTYWNPVRAGAGLPGLQFYELKHRAITWMVTPKPHGLGLDIEDVARIVGHQDGGATIHRHYLKLDQKQAVARFHDACLTEPARRARDGEG